MKLRGMTSVHLKCANGELLSRWKPVGRKKKNDVRNFQFQLNLFFYFLRSFPFATCYLAIILTQLFTTQFPTYKPTYNLNPHNQKPAPNGQQIIKTQNQRNTTYQITENISYSRRHRMAHLSRRCNSRLKLYEFHQQRSAFFSFLQIYQIN